MAAGFPTKANFATGDVLSATNMNDLAGTVNLINPSAKGDLYAGSAANTYTKLAVGANNTVLTADSSTATGLKWATPAGGGKVLQVVNFQTSTPAQIASSTWTDTGVTVTITPSASTSKILIQVAMCGVGKYGSTGAGCGLRLLRGSTTIIMFEELAGYLFNNNDNDIGGSGTTYLDSPATTSATTYKVQFNNYGGTSGGAKINRAGGGTASSITVLEIGA